eukprot:1324102-Amorphochlora_amoeboformis.AAC.1
MRIYSLDTCLSSENVREGSDEGCEMRAIPGCGGQMRVIIGVQQLTCSSSTEAQLGTAPGLPNGA